MSNSSEGGYSDYTVTLHQGHCYQPCQGARPIATCQTVTLETQQEQLHLVPFSLVPHFENHLHLNVLFNVVENALLLQTFSAQTGLKSFGDLSKSKITLPLKEQCMMFISGLLAVGLEE